MDRNERRYREWLRSEMLRWKKRSLFSGDRDKREMDIEKFFEHINRKYPFLAKRIFRNALQVENITRDELMALLSRTKKGTIVKWTDKNGKSMYFLNKGRNIRGRKSITVLGDTIDYKELRGLRGTYFHDAIIKDIRRQYLALRREQMLERERRRRILRLRFLKKYSVLPTAGTFEREVIREIRMGSDPMAAARSIIALMTEADKKRLAGSWLSKGMRSNADVGRYIASLQAKALRHSIQNVPHIQERTVARKSFQMGRER